MVVVVVDPLLFGLSFFQSLFYIDHRHQTRLENKTKQNANDNDDQFYKVTAKVKQRMDKAVVKKKTGHSFYCYGIRICNQ